MAAAAVVFFLPQTPVGCPEEEEVLESEYLPAAVWPQVGRESLPPLAEAEAVNQPEQLRGAGTPQPQSGGLPTQLPVPSRNTTAEAGGKSGFVRAMILPYQIHCAPGTPLSDSLLISKEIL